MTRTSMVGATSNNNNNNNASGEAPQRQQQYSVRNVTQCRQQGFDPPHLACSTCDLLPSTLADNCRHCCQNYKDVASLLHPYQAAVLVHYESRGMTTPVDELLQDQTAWDKFVAEQLGGRLQVLKLDPMERIKSERDIMAMLSMQRSLAGEVLFFDERLLDSKKISYEKAKTMAKERVHLRDLSQDDIRDMLKTLLPPLAAPQEDESSNKKKSSSSWSFF